MERKYVDLIMFVLKKYNIKKLKIQGLEKDFSISDINGMLNEFGLHLSKTDKKMIRKLKNNLSLKLYELPRFITLILRDCIWCRLIDENKKCIIEFGYDYYIYILGIFFQPDEIKYFEKLGLYIQNITL